MEKSLKYFTSARLDSEKAKIENYFGSMDFEVMKEKV